jgi:DNA-binding GntR family transcriptional regulator
MDERKHIMARSPSARPEAQAQAEPRREAAPATPRRGRKSGAKPAVPLSVQAYEAIKERIITLFFMPGQYVNEADVAALLDLGRTPVHQALQRLSHEGLVEILPRKGIIIRPDTVQEILKILDSRMTVEPELAAGAATRASADQVHAILESAAATPSDTVPPDIPLFTRNDRLFHQNVAEASGNEVMSAFARQLHERSIRFWYLHLWQTIDVGATNTQHLDIARAIAENRSADASSAMAEHIDALRERLKQLPGGFLRG